MIMITTMLSLFALFGVMVYRHVLVMSRYSINFISSFITLFVITIVLLFASFMFTSESAQKAVGNATKSLLTGLVIYGLFLFLFISATLWTMGSSIRQEQLQGTLEAFYLTPANRFLYLTSRLVQPLVSTIMSAVVIIFFVQLLFGGLPVHNIGLATITLFFTVTGISGLGFCFASLTLIIKDSAEIVANILRILLLVVCAIFFSFRALPIPLQFLSHIIPLSYCVDLFRSALLGFPAGFPELAPSSVEIPIVVITGLIQPFVGYWVYRRVEDYVRTSGSLSDY